VPLLPTVRRAQWTHCDDRFKDRVSVRRVSDALLPRTRVGESGQRTCSGGGVGVIDELRQTLFATQPPEGTGGFTTDDLLRLGARVGLTGSDFVSGVETARYEKWVLSREAVYQAQDPQGTPAAWLDGNPLDSKILFDRPEFERRLRA
jgi:hypothetical protein